MTSASEPAEPADAISIPVAGRLLDLSTERIRQLVKAGHAVGAGRGKVRLVSLLRGYSAFLRAEIGKPESEAMARTHFAKAAMISSTTARRRAELMPREDAETALAMVRGVACRHLRGLTIGRALKGLPAPVCEAVKREVEAAVEQIGEAEREAKLALVTGDFDKLGQWASR